MTIFISGKTGTNKEFERQRNSMERVEECPVEIQDLPLFNFDDLVVATNNFSESNKLGRGGFGSVYQVN